jgi:hypothetical protein
MSVARAGMFGTSRIAQLGRAYSVMPQLTTSQGRLERLWGKERCGGDDYCRTGDDVLPLGAVSTATAAGADAVLLYVARRRLVATIDRSGRGVAGLILALRDSSGPVTRLMVGLAGWDSRPRRLDVAGRVVRLGWFTTQPVGLLTAICAAGDRVDLLVVPPDMGAAAAQAARALAAQAANTIHAPTCSPPSPIAQRRDGAADHLGVRGRPPSRERV